MKTPVDKLEDNVLYDTALEEIVQAMPPIPDQALLPISHIRTLMIAAWLRGVAWQQEKENANV